LPAGSARVLVPLKSSSRLSALKRTVAPSGLGHAIELQHDGCGRGPPAALASSRYRSVTPESFGFRAAVVMGAPRCEVDLAWCAPGVPSAMAGAESTARARNAMEIIEPDRMFMTAFPTEW
jgi:hypothetical protein